MKFFYVMALGDSVSRCRVSRSPADADRGGRAERAEVGMQNRKGEEARWRRVTRLLFGHQWRDPLLDLVRELLSHASRRLCIFSPKDNQVSSYAEETLH